MVDRRSITQAASGPILRRPESGAHSLRLWSCASLALLGLAGAAAERSESDVPLHESAAYRALIDEMEELRQRIAHMRSFADVDERKRERRRLARLERVRRRVEGYAFALPAGCERYQVLAQRSPTRTVRVLGPRGESVGRGPSTYSPGFKPAWAYTPKDVACRPRMAVSDRTVALVREAERLRDELDEADTRTPLDERRAKQRRLAEVERELRRLGVPGGLYAPATEFERVDLEITGGRSPEASPERQSP